MDMLNIVGFEPVNRDEQKRSAKNGKAAPPEGFGSGAAGRPGSAYRGRSGVRPVPTQQRNARRRVVAAATTGGARGVGGAPSREEGEQIVSTLTAEEREVLRMVEDEIYRAETTSVSLKLAYPKLETAVEYAPLYETPRYYGTVLLAWMLSARRAKHGIAALSEDFVMPSAASTRKTGKGKGSKGKGGGGAPRIGLAMGSPGVERADMGWLAKQRGAAGGPNVGGSKGRVGAPGGKAKVAKAKASTAPSVRVKTGQGKMAPRGDTGQKKLVLRGAVNAAGGASSDGGGGGGRPGRVLAPRAGAPRVRGVPKRAPKGDPGRYGYDQPESAAAPGGRAETAPGGNGTGALDLSGDRPIPLRASSGTPTTGLLGVGAGSMSNHHFTGAHPARAVGRSELGFLTSTFDPSKLGPGGAGGPGGAQMRLTEML